MTKPVVGLAVLVAVLLLTGASPVILLLLACPVMMIFMMRGMNHESPRHEMGHEKEK